MNRQIPRREGARQLEKPQDGRTALQGKRVDKEEEEGEEEEHPSVSSSSGDGGQ